MANNTIKFYKGLEASLPASGVNGALYITTDEGGIYLGTGTGMKRLGDFVQVDKVASLPEKAHENCLYYCVAENILAKWNGTEWKQINKQPTAEELKTLLGLGSMAYLSEVSEANLSTGLAEKINASAEGNHAHSNKDVLDGITAEKVTAWDAAEGNAKSYADTELAKKVDKAEGKSLVADTEIARLAAMSDGANKVEASETNGNIKIDGVETVVYTHPANHTIAEVTGLQDAIDDAKKAGTDAQDALDTYKETNDQALADEVKAREDADTAINNKIGEVTEGKTVVQMIADAQTAATYDDEEVRGLISDNADAIAAEKERAEGVEANLQTQINTIMNNPDTEGVINSINEFTQYIADHGEIAEGFRTDIDANTKAIEDHEALAAETYEFKTDASAKLTEAKGYTDTAKAAVIGTAEDASTANTVYGAKKYAEEKASAAQSAAEATAAGVLASARTEITAEIDADVKALADGAVATNTAAIATKANAADVYAKTETYTQAEVDAAIEAATSWGSF